MGKKDNEGDRVWNGLTPSDDYLSEDEIRSYISDQAKKEFDAERFIRLTQKTLGDLYGSKDDNSSSN